jgi:pyruvate dehydrogenase E1 component alpha subunit
MRGHYEGDPASYRSKEVTEEWAKKDPIKAFGEKLLEMDVTQEELDAIDAAMDAEIEAAMQFALDSPYPDVSEVTLDVYASDNERSVAR